MALPEGVINYLLVLLFYKSLFMLNLIENELALFYCFYKCFILKDSQEFSIGNSVI